MKSHLFLGAIVLLMPLAGCVDAPVGDGELDLVAQAGGHCTFWRCPDGPIDGDLMPSAQGCRVECGAPCEPVNICSASETTSTNQSAIKTPSRPAWYKTCADDLLVCSPGYGATQFSPSPDCPDHAWLIVCTLGAENP